MCLSALPALVLLSNVKLTHHVYPGEGKIFLKDKRQSFPKLSLFVPCIFVEF